jgi:hypothetical protein
LAPVSRFFLLCLLPADAGLIFKPGAPKTPLQHYLALVPGGRDGTFGKAR